MQFLYFLSTLAIGAVASPLAKIQPRVLPYGSAIFSCVNSNEIALTFDDGPSSFTTDLISKLNAAGAKATFFFNGLNTGNIDNHRTLVQTLASTGHQVASHTWTHADLTTLSAAGIASEMNLLDDKLFEILGKMPTYMRPPYFAYNTTTLSVLGNLGYHVIHADIDTNDWQYKTLATYETAVGLFEDGLKNGGSITLMHDIHQVTVENLVPRVLALVAASGKTAVTVGKCLNDPEANWYRSSRFGSTPTTTTTAGTFPTTSAPSTGCTKSYTVVSGDYCYKVWTDNGITEAQLRAWNPTLSTACDLQIGQVLCVGQGSVAATSTTTPATTTTTSSRTTTTTTSSSRTTTTSSRTTTTTSASRTTTSSSRTTTTTTRSTTTSTRPTTTSSRTTTTTTRSTTRSTTTSASPSATVKLSPDGSCGGTVGYSCPNSGCCSQYGWCGTTSAYCGTGCQKTFGKCT